MKSPRTAFVALALLFVTGACTPSRPDRIAAPETVRAPPAGPVIGAHSDYGSDMWLGIPYAQPPVGPLRWRAPRALAPWTETRKALAFGSPCVQYTSLFAGVEGPEGAIAGDEDCLFLNVWAPRQTAAEATAQRRPVMVWIHGGGNSIGNGAFYDGGRLAAERDVLVVTLNYRLGPFGWFRHPALRGAGTSIEDQSGNYGTLDHIHALHWVRDNIAAFGGDPNNVTIFGESAGGLNVMALLVSPRAQGLFHRAIVQSGSPRTVALAAAENFVDDDDPGVKDSSNEALLRLLQAGGVRADRASAKEYARATNAPTLETYLRERTPEEIMSVYEMFGRSGMIELPKLFADGHVLPKTPIMDGFARRDGHQPVPVMLGTNRDENKLFMYIDDEWVWQIFGIIPWVYDSRMYDLNAEYMAKMWKAVGADEPAAALTASGNENVFVYRFDWDEEPRRLGVDLAQILGASHGFEIPFVFGHFDLGRAANIIFTKANLPGREELASRMMSYWTEFAYSGAPGRGREGNLPPWESWGEGRFLVLDTEAGGGLRLAGDTVTQTGLIAALGADPRLVEPRERCRVLRSLARWSWGFGAEDYVRAFDGACAAYPIAGYPW